MQRLKNLLKKYHEFIAYGICGVGTVLLNLVLYKLFLNFSIYYVISSIVSYFIASLVSYFLNLKVVFHTKISGFKNEIIKLGKYFLVRIGSVIIDTLLLVLLVEIFNIDEFVAKLCVSFVVISITFILNRKILKDKKEN